MAGFKETLDNISRKKWGPILGMLIAFILGFLLLAYVVPMLCFGYLLVAAVVFFIPYYFGLKKFKQLAVWGIIFILIVPIPYAALLVDSYDEYGNRGLTAHDDDNTLVNGKVDPYHYNPDNNTYVFTIEADERYTGVILEYVNAMHSSGVEKVVMTNTGEMVDGKVIYEYALENPSGGLYQYQFSGEYISEENGELKSVKTTVLLGPITYDGQSLYIDTLKGAYTGIVIYVGLLYFLLAYMMWSSQRNRKILEERRAQNQPKEGSDGKFYCPKCNSEVIKGQRFCPQCGENFAVDPVEARAATTPFKGADDDFFCTECGTKVDENAQVCPGCGKKFE